MNESCLEYSMMRGWMHERNWQRSEVKISPIDQSNR